MPLFPFEKHSEDGPFSPFAATEAALSAAESASAPSFDGPQSLLDIVSAVQQETAATEAALASVTKAVADLRVHIASKHEEAEAEQRRQSSLFEELTLCRRRGGAGRALLRGLEDTLEDQETQLERERNQLEKEVAMICRSLRPPTRSSRTAAEGGEDHHSTPPSPLTGISCEGRAPLFSGAACVSQTGASAASVPFTEREATHPQPSITALSFYSALVSLFEKLKNIDKVRARQRGEPDKADETTAAAVTSSPGSAAPRKRPRIVFDERCLESVVPVSATNPNRCLPRQWCAARFHERPQQQQVEEETVRPAGEEKGDPLCGANHADTGAGEEGATTGESIGERRHLRAPRPPQPQPLSPQHPLVRPDTPAPAALRAEDSSAPVLVSGLPSWTSSTRAARGRKTTWRLPSCVDTSSPPPTGRGEHVGANGKVPE